MHAVERDLGVDPGLVVELEAQGAATVEQARTEQLPDYRTIDAEAFATLLGRSGIGPGMVVVFYGYAPAIGFWLLDLVGHAEIRVLDCSRDRWLRDGRPWTDRASTRASTRYPMATLDGPSRARVDDVVRAIDDPAATLLDVRTDLEFAGERFWPSGGLEETGRAGSTRTDRSATKPPSGPASPVS